MLTRLHNKMTGSSRLLLQLMMNILQGTWLIITAAVLSGIFAGLGSATLVATLNAVITTTSATDGLLLNFSLALVLLLCGGFLSSYLLVSVSQSAAFNLRMHLAGKILSLPFSDLEKRGGAKLLAALTGDVQSLSQVIAVIPGVVISLAMICGCLVYLAWLSTPCFLLVLGGLLFGMVTHRLLARSAVPFWRKSRNAKDRLFKYYKTITEGAKELQLNGRHRQEILNDDICSAAQRIKDNAVRASRRYVLAAIFMQMTFFLLIGAIAFASNDALSATVKSGFILTTLFLVGPVRHLLSVADKWAVAKIAIAKLDGLGLFSVASPSTSIDSESQDLLLERVDFREVGYQHLLEGQEAPEFCVGPIDLTLHNSEITFVIGGNGSGKSTLMKLLTGLYAPSTGRLQANSLDVNADNIGAYRQSFSAVFFDFHLFERAFASASAVDKALVKSWMDKLEIKGSVLQAAAWEGEMPLSQGQKRRLALIAALLSDRKFFVFDEWAADQDKHYKQFFYYELLPELKRQGKGVVVVSHDDGYFDAADRVIKMEDGVVVEDSTGNSLLGCHLA